MLVKTGVSVRTGSAVTVARLWQVGPMQSAGRDGRGSRSLLR